MTGVAKHEHGVDGEPGHRHAEQADAGSIQGMMPTQALALRIAPTAMRLKNTRTQNLSRLVDSAITTWSS
jgi:hypothetical protein